MAMDLGFENHLFPWWVEVFGCSDMIREFISHPNTWLQIQELIDMFYYATKQGSKKVENDRDEDEERDQNLKC